MAKLFGFQIDKIETGDKKSKILSPVPKNDEDKSDYFVGSGFYGQYVDIDGVFKNENEMVRRYREMSLHPECDSAIEDIVNEAIVSDLNDSPIQIDLTNLPASDKLKDIIRKEFKHIKEIMDFDKKAHEIFRNWYIDGRIFYHKVIDLAKPHEGIKELRYIDPLKIRYIRKIKKKQENTLSAQIKSMLDKQNQGNVDELISPEIEEFYLYDPSVGTGPTFASLNTNHSSASKAIKLTMDSITSVTSGLVDRNKQLVLSYLHKAIKALNQLRMIEDSIVIYRLSRASEKRLFYIDVGNLPKNKAEQYMRDVMNRYRNKLVYNADTGEIKDDRKYMAMLEDYWLPRREGGRGTEVDTLPGGQNLGELADIEYFQKKLYKSLGVPSTRLDAGGGFNLGRSSEILRDELKFTRFVGRLRKRFSQMFVDILKTQLILKNIVTLDDWEILSDHIQFDFLYDNHFSELKKNEIMNDKLGVVAAMDPYIGRYFSVEYVRRNILNQTDEEIIEINAQIEKETELGIIQSPEELAAMQNGGQPPGQGGVDTLGAPVKEPGVSTSNIEPGEI
jgi:polyhydroxyalkanoate synthesis regulator phasin